MEFKYKLKIRVKQENNVVSDIVIKHKYGFFLVQFDSLILKMYFNLSLKHIFSCLNMIFNANGLIR